MENDPTELLAVARGDEPADLLLTDARVVNVFSGEVIEANIAIAAGRIAGVGDYSAGREVVSVGGAAVAPGFIDAHVHIESSLLPPHEFARAVLRHGTTAVVADPHEIANVLGLDGVRYMLESAATGPLRVFIALPSCVPATHMETAGAALGPAELAELFDDPRVVSLGEMMNYPGAIGGDADVAAKLRLGSRKTLDGHAPGVRARALQAYASTGISSDHESTALDEARDKLRAGMQVFIREGSAARNLDALLPLVTPGAAHRFCFCSDDRHPEDLVRLGHMDHIIRRAVEAGLDPVLAIRMATIHTARHFNLPRLGAVAPGYRADLVVFDAPTPDLTRAAVRDVLISGRAVVWHGKDVAAFAPAPVVPSRGGVRLPAGLSEERFAIPAASAEPSIRVIGLTNAQLTTECLVERAVVRAGRLVADPDRDLAKLAVIERHSGTGNIGLGFVRGFGLRRGALASTVAHDSHNLLVVGLNDADMLAAARAVAQAGGGQAVVAEGRVRALLPLPIAGLMSDRPLEAVVELQKALREAAADLGCRLHDPFMPLSFLSLPVIPRLKLTDRGLVDVERFCFVPLTADPP